MSHAFTLADVSMLEEDRDDVEPIDAAIALQRALNAGLWGLQGSYGRSMMAALEAGDCMLGPQRAQDAYGNQIPSRDDVQPGTKGSRQLVVDTHGEAWARRLDQA